jgi:two-component system, NarL family, nitrate/nitrite response regulator NarL
MRQIFISRSETMLADWELAFPKAEIYQDLSQISQGSKQECVYWLHNGYERKIWLEGTMKKLLAKQPNTKMIVLADVPAQMDAFAAIASGAVGYCHAYSSAKLLKEVLTVVSHGGIWMGQEFLQKMIMATSKLVGNPSEEIEATLKQLTKRERDVALQAAKGLSNKEIARVLKITERTVKAHLTSVFERLNIKDRLHLALILNEKASQLALNL